MFLNSWSLALSLCGLLVLVLTGIASTTAIKILRCWNPGSDSNLQIRLESETWLAATLVSYGLGFQITSLVLFVLAADHYWQVIPGAMCATGALTANQFGVPALLLKIGGAFLYGFWIIVHQLDIRSEHSPLVRLKFGFLLLLLPVLAADILLQTLYIAALQPDIITSCCAVVFSPDNDRGAGFLIGMEEDQLLMLFYSTAAALAAVGLLLGRRPPGGLQWLFAFGWVCFFPVAVLTLIIGFSPYIYAMPSHRCPFCLLQPEYGYIGYFLYGSLVLGTFLGLAGGVAGLFRARPGLAGVVPSFQNEARRWSLLLFAAFVSLSSYHLLIYWLAGGER